MSSGDLEIEYYERGYSEVPDKHICVDCLMEVTGDGGLLELAQAKIVELNCNYCTEGLTGTPIEVFIERVVDVFRNRYGLADETLPYESAEGGFQGNTWDTYDLMDGHFKMDHPFTQDLLHCVCDQTWSEKDPFGLRGDAMLHFSWRNFSQLVQHSKRFMFFDHDGGERDRDIYSPLAWLSALEALIERLELFSEIEVHQTLYRIRPGKSHHTLKDLITPPDNRTTQPNRMNPPGIGMLYAAFDEGIAIRETLRPIEHPQDYVLAHLHLHEPIRILDLSKLMLKSLQPSFFDLKRAKDYYLVPFLEQFVHEISQPISADVAPFEYVPTQILTEFFRYGMRSSSQISGFQYRSAHNQTGETHASLVLFMNHDESQKRLRLTHHEARVFPSE